MNLRKTYYLAVKLINGHTSGKIAWVKEQRTIVNFLSNVNDRTTATYTASVSSDNWQFVGWRNDNWRIYNNKSDVAGHHIANTMNSSANAQHYIIAMASHIIVRLDYLNNKSKLTTQKISKLRIHDDVIKWKHFPRNWSFVRGIHRSRWIPRTKASDAELWCFLWFTPE